MLFRGACEARLVLLDWPRLSSLVLDASGKGLHYREKCRALPGGSEWWRFRMPFPQCARSAGLWQAGIASSPGLDDAEIRTSPIP